MTNKYPAEQGHRKRFDQPVDEQSHADAAPVLFDLVQSRKINLHQHRDNHHPNQQPDGQIDLRDFHCAQLLKRCGHELPQNHTDHDAQRDPETEIAFKHAHRLG